MTIPPLKKILPWAILIVVIILSLLDRCGQHKKTINQAIEIQNYKDTAIMLNNATAVNKALEIEQENIDLVINKLTKENTKYQSQIDHYKAISSLTKVRTETKIDTVSFNFTDTINCVFNRNISIDSTNYHLNALFTNKTFRLNSLIIPNEQLIVVGKKKSGLFKPKPYEVTITNTNPLVKTTGLQNYTIQPKMPVLTLGISCGYGITENGLSPYLGVSLNKPIINLISK